MVIRLLFASLLFACSSPSKSAATEPAAPAAPAASNAPAAPAADSGGPGLGQKCGEGDACGKGTCVSYSGIAGPKGPSFKTCEIKCDGAAACPDGTKCMVVADGPGRVCR
jgi:hypothetical protein